jgi:hypothetical protein
MSQHDVKRWGITVGARAALAPCDRAPQLLAARRTVESVVSLERDRHLAGPDHAVRDGGAPAQDRVGR